MRCYFDSERRIFFWKFAFCGCVCVIKGCLGDGNARVKCNNHRRIINYQRVPYFTIDTLPASACMSIFGVLL